MTAITNSITIGGAAYPSPFTLSSAQIVKPSASAATAVYLVPGASLNNQGLIQGGSYGGVGIYLTTGTISNSGTVSGGAGSTQGPAFPTDGGYGLSASGAGVILNAGEIRGGAGGAGNNGALYSAAGGAVYLYGASLENTGLILGGAGGAYQAGSAGQGGAGGNGVKLDLYATLSNSGTIQGGAGGAGAQAGSGGYGVFMQIYSTLINTGVITGGAAGTGTTPEGSGAGVYLRGGVLVDSGTISGAARTNSSGEQYAVRFGVIDAATLVVEAGAKFGGVVWANGIQPDVLELGGSAAVTLSGIGSEYKYFNNIRFAGSGPEVIAGNSYGLANGVTIAGMVARDTIVLDGFAASGKTVANGAELTLSGGGVLETLDIAGSLSAADFTISVLDGNTTITNEVLCFRAGTRIAVPGGEVAVEDLRIGDAVMTLHAGPQRVRWIGRRAYDARFIAGNFMAVPVEIAAGALAPGVPSRALRVSPGHGLHVDGVLVPAWRLINGVSITQPLVSGVVAYFHLELDSHEIVLAEGCPMESYLEIGTRLQFENANEVDGAMAAPGLTRVGDGFWLEAIRARVARRAGIVRAEGRGALRGWVDVAGPERLSGWALDEAAPERPVVLDVFAGGRRVGRVLANAYRGDVRAAGIGGGCHGFEMRLPAGVRGPVEVRRAGDGAVVPGEVWVGSDRAFHRWGFQA
jgi:hypothetical protein